MRTSSNTARVSFADTKIVVSGMTGVEVGRLLSRLRYMQKTGLLKEVFVERTHTEPSTEGVRLHSDGDV